MINNGNTAWLLLASILVLLMTPSLSFFYAGLAPERNVLNTLKMSFVCLAVIPLLWMVCGFSLVFSGGNALIGDMHLAFLNHVADTNQSVPLFAFVFFQTVFAIIAPALISGSFVGRIRFKPYLLFITLWAILVYLPIAHWIWGPTGWLDQLHALDFAGGLVIHINAGFAGLIGAAMLGPRITKDKDLPHNVPFVALGCSLLWVGWFGFNAGSAGAANNIAALASLNTLLAPAASALIWIFMCWAYQKPASISGYCFAIVVGLVAITPAAGYVSPMNAVIIGLTAAVICYLCLTYKKQLKFDHIDDTLDVFICHGVSGVVGSIMVGLFASQALNPAGENGLFYGNIKQFWVQLIATLVVVVYSMGMTALILLFIRRFMAMRPTIEDEIKGIDILEHGESAYGADTR